MPISLGLPIPAQTKIVAKEFQDRMGRLHDDPPSIVHNWDPLFLNHLWRKYFQLQQTQLEMNTAYHPQPDGQIEIVRLGNLAKWELESEICSRFLEFTP